MARTQLRMENWENLMSHNLYILDSIASSLRLDEDHINYQFNPLLTLLGNPSLCNISVLSKDTLFLPPTFPIDSLHSSHFLRLPS